jgi:hypothetical protein
MSSSDVSNDVSSDVSSDVSIDVSSDMSSSAVSIYVLSDAVQSPEAYQRSSMCCGVRSFPFPAL